LNFVLFVYLMYLIAASVLIRVGSDELTTRLQLFGALCSALTLHALLLLVAAPRIDPKDGE
jgi:hypothetical protein